MIGTTTAESAEAEHEMVLHEERPIVEKVAEPVERIRWGTLTDTEQETVSEQVRKDKVEVQGGVDKR